MSYWKLENTHPPNCFSIVRIIILLIIHKELIKVEIYNRSIAQYQSDEDEQFEMEPMDMAFEESSFSRYGITLVKKSNSHVKNSKGCVVCAFHQRQ